ncbi:MAG TPA: hypothetical protein VH518_09435 [Tepidisphaeraceae bacterium]
MSSPTFVMPAECPLLFLSRKNRIIDSAIDNGIAPPFGKCLQQLRLLTERGFLRGSPIFG